MEYHGDRWPLRNPCVECGATVGRIATKGGQDRVFCICGKHQYNAPKTETGREPRTVTTVHNGISPRQRARVLMRATGRCEICGARKDLHVGHLLSVEAGLRIGMTEAVLNADENLAAMCDECNLGIGKEPVPLRLAVAIVMNRNEGDHANLPDLRPRSCENPPLPEQGPDRPGDSLPDGPPDELASPRLPDPRRT